MKLRLRGNSIRMRLTQSEVERLLSEDAVEERVEFNQGDSGQFCYRLRRNDKDVYEATYANNTLEVSVPKNVLDKWVAGDEVGIEADSGKLSLLIEKDFACLKPRPGEDQTDHFPHPDVRAAC